MRALAILLSGVHIAADSASAFSILQNLRKRASLGLQFRWGSACWPPRVRVAAAADTQLIVPHGPMEIPTRLSQTLSMAVGLLTFSFLVPSAVSGATILTIDISNPSAVVVSSTGANSQNDSVGSSFDGITLAGFLSGNTFPLDQPVDSGTLDVLDDSSATTRDSLRNVFVGDFPGGWTLNDLNFYFEDPVSGPFTMNFFSSERALEGRITQDLGALGGLPSIGATGDVVQGLLDSNSVIGQWAVVPEPSTVCLLGAALLGLMVFPVSRSRTVG